MDLRMNKISERDSKNHWIDISLIKEETTLVVTERSVRESGKTSKIMLALPLKIRTFMGLVKMKMILSRTKIRILKEVNVISFAALSSAAWMQMYIMARSATREWWLKQQIKLELILNRQQQPIMKIYKLTSAELIKINSY
jgi:hypothetical protein